MSTRSGILAGGNWIVDKLKLVDVYPQQDALANILSQTVGNGGSPFNLLVDLARLGASMPLTGIGLVGDDADGNWILEQCAQNAIDTYWVHVHPTAPTSYTDVMTVQATGRRTFFHQRGANAFLNDDNFDFETVPARIFHLGYLLLLDLMDQPDAEYGTMAARTLQRAKAAGFKTSIDVVSEDGQRFANVVRPALRHVDYCIMNEFEIGRTVGLEIRKGEVLDLVELEKAAGLLLEAGVQEWVIVHFPEGACALGRDGKLHFQGSLRLPQGEIISAVGAGDAFAAGVLYGLHEGAEIGTVLRYGVCAAGASLQGTGASNGVRPLKECLAMETEFGIRPQPGL